MKRRLLLVYGFLFLVFSSVAQHKEDAYNWKKLDSLTDQALPRSAETLAGEIYQQAVSKGDRISALKAQLYIMQLSGSQYREADSIRIRFAEKEAAGAPAPYNSIWYSIAAQAYWNYYQQYRWKILDRSQLGQAPDPDFSFWDARQFHTHISRLYLLSLADARTLQQADITQFSPVLTPSVNTTHLRPTLFDLLSFRALSYFENGEKDIINPSWKFTLNDSAAFADATGFTAWKPETRDTGSLHFTALRLYQDLLRFHMRDAEPSALIYTDLERLRFVHQHHSFPDKHSLYLQSLRRLAAGYSGHELSGLALYRIAEAEMHTPGVQKKKADLPGIRQQLEKIEAAFPSTEGAVLAQGLRQQILEKQLQLRTEEVVLPDAASLLLLSYKNINRVWLRVIPVNRQEYPGWNRQEPGKLAAAVRAKQALYSWDTQLPGSEDLDLHSAEVKIDPLPEGMYVLLVSESPDFDTSGKVTTAIWFQASRLSILSLNQTGKNMPGPGFILDRKTGAPVAGATITYYTSVYDRDVYAYRYKTAGKITSGRDGSFSMPGNSVAAIEVEEGGRHLFQDGYFHRGQSPGTNPKQLRSFFFTDRSIYRPGQTVYYKAILTESADEGRSNRVLAGRETTITFYDANGQQVASQKLRSNEYGSVQGSFTAPESGLTGSMRISNESGSCGISVEAYKRPRFAVHFDTLQKEYGLNETVSISGRAETYSGAAVDGASVRYRVVRRSRFPYPWLFYGRGIPSGAETELAYGDAETDAAGNFTISFTTLPDPSADPATLPVFSYSVHADVTDPNGETRSATTSLPAGYRSLEIISRIPELAQPEDLDTLHISTSNLSGSFTEADIRLRIVRLKGPEKLYRNRLWEKPDQQIMDEQTFRQFFPDDVFLDENNPETYAVSDEVLTRTLRTSSSGTVAVPASVWNKNGWYLIELTGTDRTGNTILEKKFVQVYASGRSRQPLIRTSMIIAGDKQYKPGETASVQLLSGMDNGYWIFTEQPHGGGSLQQINTTTGKPWTWSRKISDSDRGGIILQWIAVKDNRIYREMQSVSVPWSNKELHIEWESHREKLEPGAEEKWTLSVKGEFKEAVASELAATLYDASLDAFRPHAWQPGGLYPQIYPRLRWTEYGFGTRYGYELSHRISPSVPSYERSFPDLILQPTYSYPYMMRAQAADGLAVSSVRNAAPAPASRQEKAVGNEESADSESAGVSEETPEKTAVTGPAAPARENLRETAFFFPQLHTDSSGNIRLSFTMPEALTKWKFLAFAHSREMQYGSLEGSVRTTKDLMVIPGLPRFFRQGDQITLTARITNLSDSGLSGRARIEILDAATQQPLNLPFNVREAEKNFTASRGAGATVSWEVRVPQAAYMPVMVRITASAGRFTDGESHIIPVTSNRMLVTETLPVWMNGYGTRSFRFDKLARSGQSSTLAQHRLTVEYTSNPVWYVVQALPYLAEYPYECAEQVFNRYYANALAAHITSHTPRIRSIFAQWKNESPDALLSALEKNQELKSALLEETPWVMDAGRESAQKQRIAALFETEKISRQSLATAAKLRKMLLPEGAFPWFPGSPHPDRYITQYIATSIGRLQKIGIRNKETEELARSVVPWLDRKVLEDYNRLERSKADLSKRQISYLQIQYLHMRSYFPDYKYSDPQMKKAADYYRSQAIRYWAEFNPYMKGMTALALHRGGDRQTADHILRSLKETSADHEETGTTWYQRGHGWWWYEAPVESQSLLIEAFSEIAADTAFTDRLRLWLLKQKQTRNWHTTKATADACYAMLLRGTESLSYTPEVHIELGNENAYIITPKHTEAGTGYSKTVIAREDIRPEMGSVTLRLSPAPGQEQNNNQHSYGAIYWQYFEQLDKITEASSSIKIRKQLFAERHDDRGIVLEPLGEGGKLRPGDKVKARIEITTDRDMEYVHLKDMRGSCFEPAQVLSGYRWQGGLGYYEATGDMASSFFIQYLPKGKYVFEYPMFVTHKGEFTTGIATMQCMYAPEFAGHSRGMTITVE